MSSKDHKSTKPHTEKGIKAQPSSDTHEKNTTQHDAIDKKTTSSPNNPSSVKQSPAKTSTTINHNQSSAKQNDNDKSSTQDTKNTFPVKEAGEKDKTATKNTESSVQKPNSNPQLTSSKTGSTNHSANNTASTASPSGSHKSNSNNGGNNTPPPSNSAGQRKNSPLPLIISLIALGVGGYALFNSLQSPQDDRNQVNGSEIAALQTKVSELQKALSSKVDTEALTPLNDDIAQLKQEFTTIQSTESSERGIDRAEVESLVDEKITQTKEALQQISTTNNKQSAEGLSKAEVNTLIKEALADSGNKENTGAEPAFNFNDEIEIVKKDKAEIEQYLAEIKQSSKQAQEAIEKSAQQAQSSLDDSFKQAEQEITQMRVKPNVEPLISLLMLANSASQSRQFNAAHQYLQQAQDNFEQLNLNQAPYAQFFDQLSALVDETADLAKNANTEQYIDDIINSVNQWTFINTDPKNILEQQPTQAKPTHNWTDRLKTVANSVLKNTVTITKNDAAGLTWINENPHLQEIIRENIRLDLALIRNALLLGDQQRAQKISNTLSSAISQYFDTDAKDVKQALDTLKMLANEQSDIPDITSLIQSIQHAD